jgi:hypothetical protein
MANRKISDLTALTAPASGDLLPIVDISEAAAADKNKKITIQSLFQGIPVNVGIGTASPAQALDVRTATGNAYINIGRNSQSTGQVGYYLTGGTSGTDWILYQPISSNDFRIFGNSGDRVTVTSTGSVGIGNTSPGGTLDIKAAASTAPLIVQGPSSEFARIDSSGRLLVGTSTSSGNNGALQVKQGTSACAYYEISASSGVQNAVDIRNAANAAYKAIRFHVNAYDNIVGSIDVSTTATAYSTSSDYRLKGNVVPLTGAIDRLSQLQVHRFNFIADPDKIVDGFIAHEAQAVVPECVTGEKDAVDDDGNPVFQGIDQSKLVPLLTAALQEAIAKIEALETRLSALEAA